jgi:Ribbon-helix-helix protein, copG family
MAKKSIKVIPKKRGRGRPATGKDPLVALRLPPELIAAVDAWVSRHKAASRSAAIRAMIEATVGK